MDDKRKNSKTIVQEQMSRRDVDPFPLSDGEPLQRGISGFSLVEAIVLSGAMVGILMVCYQSLTKASFSRKAIKQYETFVSFANYAKTVAGNQFNCGIGLGILTPN